MQACLAQKYMACLLSWEASTPLLVSLGVYLYALHAVPHCKSGGHAPLACNSSDCSLVDLMTVYLQHISRDLAWV